MTFDLWKSLLHLDNGDMTWYAGISDPDERNGVDKNIGWLIPQWFLSSDDESRHEYLILMFDDVCNLGWGNLKDHPELRTKLLAAIAMGSTKHTFFKPTTAKLPVFAELFNLLQDEYEDIREEDVVLWVKTSHIDELEDLIEKSGIQMENRISLYEQYERIKSV